MAALLLILNPIFIMRNRHLTIYELLHTLRNMCRNCVKPSCLSWVILAWQSPIVLENNGLGPSRLNGNLKLQGLGISAR